MLRQKALVEVLGQVNTANVEGALLFNKEGVLLAYNGYNDAKTNPNVSAALISSVWDSFNKGSGDKLSEAFLQCDDGVIACTHVANMLIALKATGNAQIGLVRTKLRALAKYLDAPLTVVSHNS